MQSAPSLTKIRLAALAVLASCSNSPAGPPAGVSFETVRQILTEDCGGCHGSGSGRFFTVAMDSAALQGSGLLDPANPAQSLINLKATAAVQHGGGLITAYTTARQTSVNEWVATLPAAAGSRVEAIKVGPGTSIPVPTIDGFYDRVWREAIGATLRVTGGWGEAEFVQVKAAYDDTYLYLLVVWDDDKPSVRRQPWIKQANGSWTTLPAKDPIPAVGTSWLDYLGPGFNEENPARFNYEDKLAIMWNTYGPSTVAGFETSGCAITCHDPGIGGRPGTRYNYTDQSQAAKKYTNATGEIADLWHWKLVRNNQHAKADDQYVRYWVPGPTGAAEGGRASDAGGAGYGNNPAVGGLPQYRGPVATVPPYYILDNQKLPLTAAELAAFAVGAELPNMITSGPTGARADIDAKGLHNTGSWGLELRRKLVTGDPNDVQFDSLDRDYAFGVAIFDNAQIEHRYTPLVAKLGFRR